MKYDVGDEYHIVFWCQHWIGIEALNIVKISRTDMHLLTDNS
jgi:hypothetical protein